MVSDDPITRISYFLEATLSTVKLKVGLFLYELDRRNEELSERVWDEILKSDLRNDEFL